MVTISLLLNILVLTPVCAGLYREADWARLAYGTPSPASRILLAIYLAILLASLLFLFWPEPAAVFALLALQVFYKATTPLTIGAIRHPVVISNLLIAAFHSVTLVFLWPAV